VLLGAGCFRSSSLLAGGCCVSGGGVALGFGDRPAGVGFGAGGLGRRPGGGGGNLDLRIGEVDLGLLGFGPGALDLGQGGVPLIPGGPGGFLGPVGVGQNFEAGGSLAEMTPATCHGNSTPTDGSACRSRLRLTLFRPVEEGKGKRSRTAAGALVVFLGQGWWMEC
jgi:hypothetical protein